LGWILGWGGVVVGTAFVIAPAAAGVHLLSATFVPFVLCLLWVLLGQPALGINPNQEDRATMTRPREPMPVWSAPGVVNRFHGGHDDRVAAVGRSRTGWAVAAISAGCVGFRLVLGGPAQVGREGLRPFLAAEYGNIVFGLVFPCVGALIPSRLPGNRLGRLYCIWGLACALTVTLYGVSVCEGAGLGVVPDVYFIAAYDTLSP